MNQPTADPGFEEVLGSWWTVPRTAMICEADVEQDARARARHVALLHG